MRVVPWQISMLRGGGYWDAPRFSRYASVWTVYVNSRFANVISRLVRRQKG